MKDLKYNNKPAKNPKDVILPEINHYSSIFQLLYNKNFKNEYKINNLNTNKTEEFLNIIENMRLNEEMVETDKDYLIKESRKEIKIKQELEYLFGKRRGKHKKTSNLGKIKLDKKIFLNPFEKKNERKYLFSNYKSKSNVNILKLPIINKSRNNKKLTISNTISRNNNNFRPSQYKRLFLSEGNSPKGSFNESGSNTNTNDEDSKKNNDNDINLNYNSCKNIKNNLRRNINSFLKSTTSRSVKKSKVLSSRSINLIFVNKYSSDIDILNDFAVNKGNKRPVINLLNNINQELKQDEKKHKKYFRINDYGCEFSKFKIKFLEKHFFK